MNISEIKNQKEGEYVSFEGTVFEIVPNKYGEGDTAKIRYTYKLEDNTGKIWTYVWGSPQLEDVYIGTKIKVNGKVGHYLKPPHVTPLVTVTFQRDSWELVTEEPEAKKIDAFMQAVGSIKKTVEPAPKGDVGVDFDNYVPEKWVRDRLEEILQDMEMIRKKLEVPK